MNISNFIQASAMQLSWSSFSRFASSSLGSWSKVILATSATALVGLGIYRWRQANQGADYAERNAGFDRVHERIKRTYAYVFGGFALTAASAVACHVSGLSLKILNNAHYIVPVTCLVSCAALIATVCISKDNEKAKHVAWGIFNVSMGMMLAPLGFMNKAVLAQAAFISLSVGGLLTLTAFLAPDRRFLEWEGPLMTALTTISIASFVAIFFPRSAFAYGVDRASLYGGLLIFSGLLMASTQRLMEEAETQPERLFDPINSSLSIYLDSMNLFIRILRILAENQKEEKKA